jgi:predicted Zn-dependent protease
VNPLPIADQHRLRAAEGWLDLGNTDEARAELAGISAEGQQHPDVLHFRWQISRKAKQWEECFTLARAFAEKLPLDPRAWTSLAQTFYYTSCYQEAYDLAVSKITAFPKYWPLYYDAACYACLTGRLPQAKQFLQLATAFGDEDEIKALAAADPDFDALRKADPTAL